MELELGCEAEPKVDPEGERELGEIDPPADELPPAVDAPPPAVDAPPPEVVLLEWPRPPQDEEEEEEAEEEEKGGERSRSGAFPAGTASESTNTSPRMCSAYWAGTPDWFTGWVNTRCNPVAVTVSSPEFVPPVPAPPIGLIGLGGAVVSV